MAGDTNKIDKSMALYLIPKLGKDKKQHDGHHRFVPI